MNDVHSLIDPFFSWKQAPGKRFAESSLTKYKPLLEQLAAWAGDQDVAQLETEVLEFEYLPYWAAAFEERNGQAPAINTVRLLHNVLASFFDYCWRRGLIERDPMAAIARPTYVVPMIDWLSAAEDEAMARVDKTPLEEIVYKLGRAGRIALRGDHWAGVQRGRTH